MNLKQQQLAALNNELSKINSRRDSNVEAVKEEENVLSVPKDGEKKERKVSRFKVSVVTEPDLNKLERRDAGNSEEQKEAVSVINDAHKNLEKVVESCYSFKLPVEASSQTVSPRFFVFFVSVKLLMISCDVRLFLICFNNLFFDFCVGS